jgi:hypothetical protein
MLHLTTLALNALALLAGGDAWKISIKPEEAGGYAANPSTLKAPLRQDLTAAELVRGANGYDLRLAGSELALQGVDLSLLIPRIPSYARGNDDLVRYLLFQREFNRNEVKFGAVGDVADFKLANNCLRTGLWEIMLDQKVENGNAMVYHGWFSFPRDEYERAFQAMNQRPFAEVAKLLAEYPGIDNMPAPLDALRKVAGERAVAVTTELSEARILFGEQKRKSKLLLNPNIATYADFVAPANQPIKTATFAEPGFYDPSNPVSFDLSWLATPAKALRRDVRVGAVDATELEISFANSYRIVVADRDLATLPEREVAPDNDKDTLRLTFGIGTPDIYASLADRTAEQKEERPNWLMLLGPDGKQLDNHSRGIDRVFCWREKGGRLHLYLVGYERIAVVAHLVVALANG